MVNKLICSINNNTKKIALLEDSELKELYIFDTQKLCSGDIVIGRISEKNANINAFFVDLGKNKSGFLPINKNNSHKVGDTLAFEVTKEAKGNKHPKLSTNITLAGAFTVYSPYSEGYSIAKSITDSNEIERLEYIAMDMQPHFAGGIMIRSAAIGVSEEAISNELRFLQAKWQKISSQTTLGLAAKSLDPVIYFIAKHKDSLEEIISDNADFLNAVKKWSSQISMDSRVFQFHSSPIDLFSFLEIEEQVAMLLEKEVYLSGGGKITIEPTTALVAIDVDSGNNHGDILNINILACKEALKQIRLRNLSGQIVIDVIKNRKDTEISKKILKHLYNIAESDSVKTRIIGVTPLGNIEITRERRFSSIYEALNDDKY